MVILLMNTVYGYHYYLANEQAGKCLTWSTINHVHTQQSMLIVALCDTNIRRVREN